MPDTLSVKPSFKDRSKIWFMRRMFGVFTKNIWRNFKFQHVHFFDDGVPASHGVIPVQVYQPANEPDDDEKLPLLMFFHGGGFVIGGIKSHFPLCQQLASENRCIVIAVDYRLAPEHPFPAAPEDCLAATAWAMKNAGRLNIDIDNIFVIGDSAGGNLAAVTALYARERLPIPIRGQILLYPVTDHYDPPTASYIENAKGEGLTRDMMIWFLDFYLKYSPVLKDGQTRHPMATPLAAESFAGLPPALVITADKDPLRDEGIAYAESLQQAGVDTTHTNYKGIRHGFIGSFGPTAAHNRAMQEINTWLADHIHKHEAEAKKEVVS